MHRFSSENSNKPLDFTLLLQAQDSRKVLEMKVDLVPAVDALRCEADKHKLGKVFRNLLSNAMKFTPKYGRIEVTASALVPIATYEHQRQVSTLRPFFKSTVAPAVDENNRATHMLRIHVKDNGAGISKVRV